MIAYNRAWLNNLMIENETIAAQESNLITTEELKAVKENYPVGFYTPNPFIRTGLFILTVIITGFVMGLLALIFLSGMGEEALGGILFFMGILCYISLELMIRTKHHYRSGVDDALLCMSLIFIVSGFNVVTDISPSANALLVFILSAYLWVRFTDMLMGAVTFLALLAFVFLFYGKTGPMAKATVPFLLMAICLFIFLITQVQWKNNRVRSYHNSLIVVGFLALVCLYLAGNYYVVREAGNMMYDLNLKEGESIPGGWLFWMFSLLIPVLYVFAGLYKKNTLLLRAGLLMAVVMVFTVRFYYSIYPMEVPMTIGGSLMILIAWLLIRYLEEPKYGFTYKEVSRKHTLDKLQVEALIITETTGTPQHNGGDLKFGGGSGGGGGATGDY